MTDKCKRPYWEGSSKKNFKEFTALIQKDMGVALFVQLGGMPGASKSWKNLVPGCTS